VFVCCCFCGDCCCYYNVLCGGEVSFYYLFLEVHYELLCHKKIGPDLGLKQNFDLACCENLLRNRK
jgi:hypothetical protein